MSALRWLIAIVVLTGVSAAFAYELLGTRWGQPAAVLYAGSDRNGGVSPSGIPWSQAVEEAAFLTKFGSEVHLIHRRDELRAAKVIQQRTLANEKVKVHWSTVVSEGRGEEREKGGGEKGKRKGKYSRKSENGWSGLICINSKKVKN